MENPVSPLFERAEIFEIFSNVFSYLGFPLSIIYLIKFNVKGNLTKWRLKSEIFKNFGIFSSPFDFVPTFNFP